MPNTKHPITNLILDLTVSNDNVIWISRNTTKNIFFSKEQKYNLQDRENKSIPIT